jgi:hypothetical protein
MDVRSVRIAATSYFLKTERFGAPARSALKLGLCRDFKTGKDKSRHTVVTSLFHERREKALVDCG